MAHMYPKGGPTKATRSQAERDVYYALKHALDDNYYVFHGTHWTSKTNKGERIREGEVDFILVHPNHGIILFEVKGGQAIECDGPAKKWASTDAGGIVHEIKDPFVQVQESRRTLLGKLQQSKTTKPYIHNYYLNTAVWFPGISWTPGNIELPHVDDAIVLDSSGLKDPVAAIARLFAYVKRRPLTPEALKALIRLLAPTARVKAKLSDQFNGEDAAFVQLRDDQYRKLDMLKYHPRVTVRGAAGTGKTVIALERARQLAMDGLEVLFVCSNASLASWLQSMIAEEPEEITSHIEIHHVDALCTQIIKQAGFQMPEQREMQSDELGSRDEQTKLSGQFASSIRKLERDGSLHTFDAIIVDEAQDIDRPLWGPLYKLLTDRYKGKFIACYDPAQRERSGEDVWYPPIPNGRPPELLLSENCRNTQAIFRLSQQFYRGIEPPACVGPDGRDIEWIDLTTIIPATPPMQDRDALALEKVLDSLIDNEGIAPHDIIVVTCRSQNSSSLYKRRSIGKHTLSNRMEIREPQSVRIVTIRSAKGLESPVIIIAEHDGLRKMRMSNQELYCRFMYIATSRAQHYLVVLNSAVDTLPIQPALSTAKF